MNKKHNLFTAYYIPLLLWAGAIFYFSSVPDLQMNTGSISIEVFVRKLAHVIEYLVLYWLVFRLLFHGYGIDLKKSLWFSFLAAVVFALSDEYHQTFTPGRTGKTIDVVFDAISAYLGMQMIAVFKNRSSYYRILMIMASIFFLSIMEFGMILEGEKTADQKREMDWATEMPVKSEEKAIGTNNDPAEKKEEPKEETTVLPPSIKITVPFTSQAPFANWDAYHEEACEEASLIMLKYFLDGRNLTPDIAEKEIQAMIAFQIKNYGDYKDTDAQKSVALFNEFYGKPSGIKLKVVYDFSREDIKKYLAKGKPIVVPAAGRLLGNPNFTPPGPLYHNLILTGYEGNTIITNDPGTRKGENYRYDINILYKAIHDFPGTKNDIESGRKAMIVAE